MKTRTSFKKGNKPWNKGKPHSEKEKREISKALKGHPGWNKGGFLSIETRQKISNAGRRRKHSLKTRMKLSELNSGEKNFFWKGGISPLNERIRKGIEYRLWREAVFARDNWMCQKCGVRSGNGKAVYLEAHHIKGFAKYPELRFAIDNGIIFCNKCHNKTKGRRPALVPANKGG